MGKGSEGWSTRHVLMLSLALNVWLLLRLRHEREYTLRREENFHGFCAEDKASNFLSHSTSNFSAIDEFDDDQDRVINLDQYVLDS